MDMQLNRFACLIGLTLLLTVVGTLTMQAQPKMKIHKTSFDLGEVSQKGGIVTRVVEFENDGDQPLVILSAETSCSCTKTSFSKKPIKPSQTGSITITYDPKKQGPTIYKAINIYTNAPQARQIVTLWGKVVP